MRYQAQLSRILLCQALTVPGLLAPQAFGADTTASKATADAEKSSTFNAAIPEGKTLPENVARFRIVHRAYKGDLGYNDHGSATDLGLHYRGGVNAIVGELGLTDRLSFRIMAPIFYRNSLGMDQDQFKKSSLYKAKYNEAVEKAAEKLVKTKLCNSTTQCREFIERGEALPFSQDIILPSGEAYTLTAGSSVKNAIEQSILNVATPPSNGRLGLGDIETGVLYNFFRSERVLLSSGIGLRLPTGKWDSPETTRPVSGGVMDVGFRFNFDFSPADGLWLSFQEQIERAVSKRTWRRPSDLDNSSYNLAEPSDGQSNTRTYEKRGFTFDSLVKANYGFGVLSPSLKALAMNVSYQNKKERAIYLDNTEYRKPSDIHWAGVGATVSGLPYKVPVDLDLNYATPISGRDARIAPSVTETSLRVYTRF